MAARINTRFLLILTIILGVIGAGLGVLYFFVLGAGIERSMARGEAQVAAGNYRSATIYFENAVAKEPTSREALDAYEAALLEISPENQTEVNEYVNDYISVLNHRVRHFPGEREHLQRAMTELHDAARMSGFSRFWVQLEAIVNEGMRALPPTGPESADARYYRAASWLFHDSRVKLAKDKELEKAREDLEFHLEAQPESDRGLALMIRDQRRQAEDFLGNAQMRRFEEAYGELQSRIEHALSVAPDGTQIGLEVLLTEPLVMRTKPADANPERVIELSKGIADRITNDSETPEWVSVEFSTAAEKLVFLDGMPSVADAIEAHLKRDPDAIQARSRLSIAYVWEGRYLEADRVAREVLDYPAIPLGLRCLVQEPARINTASSRVEIAGMLWNLAKDDAERAEAVERVKAARDDVADVVAETRVANADARVLYADAMVSFVERDYEAAAEQFEELIRGEQFSSAKVLFFAAYCLEQTNKPGLALQRLAAALEEYPNERSFVEMNIRLLRRMRRFDDALNAVQLALVSAPNDEGFVEMQTQLRREQAQASLGADNPVTKVIERAERAVQDENFEEAHELLTAALEEFPLQRDLTRFMITLEGLMGRKADAQARLDEVLGYAPSDPQLLRLKAQLASDDPLVAIELYYDSMQSPDDPEKAKIQRLRTLSTFVRDQRRIADLADARNDVDAAAAARTLATRAETQIDALEAELAPVADTHEEMLRHRLNEAIVSEDWDEADRVIRAASDADIDRAGGRTFRARVQMAKGEPNAAVTTMEGVVQDLPISSDAHDLHGQTLELAGRFEDARDAYRIAYDLNPNSYLVARRYAQMLRQLGELDRALGVLTQTRRVYPREATLRQLWLQLNEEMQNHGVVLRERRARYREFPDDVDNAYALASFLVTIEPSETTLLDDTGKRRYTPSQYQRLSAAEQARERDRERQRWQRESTGIMEETRPDDMKSDDFVRWTLVRAQLLGEQREFESAMEVLQRSIAAQTDSEMQMKMLLVAGEFCASIGANQPAARLYQQANALDPSRSEPSYYLALLLQRLSQYENSIGRLEDVRRNMEDGVVSLFIADLDGLRTSWVDLTEFALDSQIFDAELQSDRIESARARFDATFVPRRPLPYELRIMEARLLAAEADRAWEVQDVDTARAIEKACSDVLAGAEALDPARPDALVLRAIRHVQIYERTDEESQLEDALRVLDRCAKIAPNDRRVVLTRVDVLTSQGERQRAVSELTRLLEVNPFDELARNQLLRKHVLFGDHRLAADVLREAVELYGSSPKGAQWLERLGDLQLSLLDDPKQAAESYKGAYLIDPTAQRLGRMSEALLAEDPPRIDDLVEMYRQASTELDELPMLRGWLGKALMLQGNEPAAVEQLRQAYRQITARIEAQETSPVTIREWFASALRVFGEDATAAQRIDDLVRQLAGGELDSFSLSALATVWALSGDAGVERGVDLMQLAIDRSTELPASIRGQLYSDQAGMYLSIDRFDDAVRRYEDVIELLPSSSVALNNLAFILSDELGRTDEGLAYAERAWAADPRSPVTLDTLGWAHFKSGNLVRAEKFLRRSLRLRPSAGTHLHLARLYMQQERWEQANRQAERAAELNASASTPDPETQAEIDALADDIRSKREGS